MKSVTFAIVLTLLGQSAAFAAEAPDPALIQLVEKHDADVKALNAKRDVIVKQPRDAYITALNDAQAAARKAGKTNDVDAIEAERAAFEKHTFAANNPALSPRLLSIRTKFLAAHTQAQRQFQPALDTLNTSYLNSLTALEAAARKDGKDAVAKQVAAAKAKFLGVPADKSKDPAKKSDTPVVVPPKTEPRREPLKEGQSLVPNGDFSERDPSNHDHAAAWKYSHGKSVSLASENGNQFIRLDSTTDASSVFKQKVQLPDKLRWLKVGLRARISKLELNLDEAGKPKGRPALFGWVQDSSGANLKGFIIHLDRVTSGWETFETTCGVPEGGAYLSLTGEMMKSKGIVDIDDLRVTPTD